MANVLKLPTTKCCNACKQFLPFSYFSKNSSMGDKLSTHCKECDEDLMAIYPLDGKCPVLGVELEFGSAGFRENSPSIDKINPNKGYTKDNIQVISWRANRIKGDATLEELELLVAYLKQGDK